MAGARLSKDQQRCLHNSVNADPSRPSHNLKISHRPCSLVTPCVHRPLYLIEIPCKNYSNDIGLQFRS
ncbi:hypothetical protein J6590_009256 [Homalodisca vitripennis]|nr:hypothetical protein J6590_009256 [Homalodisca vitripennis]